MHIDINNLKILFSLYYSIFKIIKSIKIIFKLMFYVSRIAWF